MASPDKTPLEERLEAHYNGRYPEGMEELLAEVVRLRQDNTRLLAEQEGREPTYYIGKLQERVERLREALQEIRWLHHDDSKTYQQLWAEAARIADRVLVASPDNPPEPVR